MSDREGQDDELSEEELDSLLQELEQKADQSDQSSQSATKSPSEQQEVDLSELDASLDDSDTPPATVDAEKPPSPPDESKAEGGAPSAPEQSSPDQSPPVDERPPPIQKDRNAAFKVALRSGRIAGLLLPALLSWWVLGAILGQWISAGWLIGLVSGAVIMGLPWGLSRSIERGRFLSWLGGTALVLLFGIAIPFRASTADTLAKYGHWPATTVAPALANSQARVSQWTARTLSSSASLPEPRELGSEDRLGTETGSEPSSP